MVRDTWQGDISFLDDAGREVLLVGLHPERGSLALRSESYSGGVEEYGYRWLAVDFPEGDRVLIPGMRPGSSWPGMVRPIPRPIPTWLRPKSPRDGSEERSDNPGKRDAGSGSYKRRRRDADGWSRIRDSIRGSGDNLQGSGNRGPDSGFEGPGSSDRGAGPGRFRGFDRYMRDHERHERRYRPMVSAGYRRIYEFAFGVKELIVKCQGSVRKIFLTACAFDLSATSLVVFLVLSIGHLFLFLFYTNFFSFVSRFDLLLTSGLSSICVF